MLTSDFVEMVEVVVGIRGKNLGNGSLFMHLWVPYKVFYVDIMTPAVDHWNTNAKMAKNVF